MTYRLGIDLGSASAAIALLDESNHVIFTDYRLHKGDIAGILSVLLETLETRCRDGKKWYIAASGIHHNIMAVPAAQVPPVNEITALVAGARHVTPEAASIMEIGGQSSKYITGLHSGNIRFMVNDNCSAGTGSFFESQCARLGITLEAYSDLVDKALAIPGIAGRCSVFSKTDIIHLQQGGEKIENILNGLCYAAARNYKASVAGKLPLELPIAFAGGTVFNRGLLRSLKSIFGLSDSDLIVSDQAPCIAAIGTALNAAESGALPVTIHDFRMAIEHKRSEKITACEENAGTFLPPLCSPHTDIAALHAVHPVNPGELCTLGIDIGSTSTNLVLINSSGQVIDYQYMRTKGNPVKAVRDGFQSILARLGSHIAINAVATTGSGRHLIGRLIGADMIYDEITAQAASAARFVPEVDTVFEIGGQDSKYISIKNGLVRDFQMNKICAAGTGAFIEEQAARLDIPLDCYGERALSAKNPCNLGERCTVFIESNINDRLSKGTKKEDIAAGLCYSVLTNYLNRVVGNKPIGNRILLQGGVAYNPAITAAFKEQFGSRIEVAPWFSVSGAVGAALLAKDAVNNKTVFKGLLCLEEAHAESAEETSSAAKEASGENRSSDPLLFACNPARDPQKKTIGIPRALIIQSWFPVFNAFFQALGFNVALSPETNEKIIEHAQSYTKSELCYPVKLAIGHTVQLVQSGVDYIFFPAVHSLMNHLHGERPPGNYACVYMKKMPEILENTVGLKNRGIGLLTLELALDQGIIQPFKALYRLGRRLNRGPVTCCNALLKGIKGLTDYIEAWKKSSRTLTANTANNKFDNDKPDFVIAARGYCLLDPALNLGIKEILNERGYRVVNLFQVNTRKTNIYKRYPNLYWPFGAALLASAKAIADRDNLYAVYLTYHGCGPDGLLSHWFEDETKDKPYLGLEIDEHISKIGVITRLEAFINSASIHWKTAAGEKRPASVMCNETGFYTTIKALRKETPVIIPCLYPYSTLFTAWLRGKGYAALELPPTSPESLAKGRTFMRGKECFSLTALLGDAACYSEHNHAAQLLFPQTKGAEADGLYGYFVYRKLKSAITVVSPALEHLPDNPDVCKTLFHILLAGDIALHINDERLLQAMQTVFANGLPEDNTLVQWAHTKREHKKSILFTGEPWCIHNHLFKRIIAKQIHKAGLSAAFAPLSEMLLFDWYHQKRSKTVKRLENLMYRAAHPLGNNSPFSASLEQLNSGTSAGNFNGGFGNYRCTKAALYNEHILGVISVSSQYENTESVLELVSPDKKLPFLNLRFDGENNPVNQLKTGAFLDGIMKARI